jgi:hypothetical protein
MFADIQRFITTSGRVDATGLDLAAAAQVGLTADELFVLTYFADVENQSLRYLRTLLGMKIAFEPEVSAFLAMWNYEEFFHGYELEQLMRACGHEPGRDRRELKRRSARLNERLEALFIPLLSRLYEDEFPAVYMAFGAMQELTTLRGYEQLAAHTENAALELLCERIAKQERRHFAWYFNSAHTLLERSPKAQRLTARLLKLNWVPVGAGVHTPEQVQRLFRILFYPRDQAAQIVRDIDGKIATLPGLEELSLMQRYFARAGLV